MNNILILGAGGPAGVNFCKSLRISPNEYRLIGTDCNEHHLFLMETNIQYLIPRADSTEYLPNLQNLIEIEDIEFVHAQPDIEVKYLGKYRNHIKAKTFLPKQETIEICQNKYESWNKWIDNKITVPNTVFLNDNYDIERSIGILGSPVWVRSVSGAGGKGSTLAKSAKTIRLWIKYWESREVEWEFIVQEYLPGRNIGWHSLWKDGKLITSMARERLEYIYPYLSPSGITGTPVVQKTIHDNKVNRIAKKAVLAIDSNYNGIACVDLKENKDGVPCPTEINSGRFFTTSFFFSLAGLNIPWIYTELGLEHNIGNKYLIEFNPLPEDFYWIRHMDVPGRLIRDSQEIGRMYQ